MPPAARSASARTSMQPPAAPRPCAVRPVHPGERIEHLEEEDEGRNEHALGQALAAQLAPSARSSTSPLRFGVRDQPAQRVGRMHDVGVGEQQVLRRGCAIARAAMPCFMAQSLPVQPGGKRAARTTVSRSRAPAPPRRARAISAVPSSLSSSTSDERERRDSPARSSEADALRDDVGLVARRHHGRDRAASAAAARRAASSRSPPSQKPPRASTR